MRHLLLPLCLLGVTTSLLAQAPAPVITENAAVDTPTLRAWLHSGDPRLMAWAAVFAERTHDGVILGEMPAALAGLVFPSSSSRNEAGAAQRRAAMAMLDALIVEKSAVPPNTIAAVAETLPAQALILMERLPLTQSRETLGFWATGNGSGWSGRQLTRVAAMLLAKEPRGESTGQGGLPKSFVAAVVREAEDRLTVVVTTTGGYATGNGLGGACGDSLSRAVTPGWPEVYTYELNESPQTGQGTTLLDLDGDRISWQRYKENGGWGSCGGVPALNATTRHRLVAYWLGIPGQQMTWQPQHTEAIVWSDKAAYERQLGTLVDAERAKLRGTVDALRAQGLLPDQEDAMPALLVTIECRLTPCPLD